MGCENDQSNRREQKSKIKSTNMPRSTQTHSISTNQPLNQPPRVHRTLYLSAQASLWLRIKCHLSLHIWPIRGNQITERCDHGSTRWVWLCLARMNLYYLTSTVKREACRPTVDECTDIAWINEKGFELNWRQRTDHSRYDDRISDCTTKWKINMTNEIYLAW